jgi:ribosomal protein L36
MKVVASIGRLKKRAKSGQVVKRRGYLFLLSPCRRFKVRQGRAKMKRGKFK